MYGYYTPSCGSVMRTLTNQLDTKLQPIVVKYDSDKWAKKLTTREHLEIMVSAQLTQSKSLSDITSMVAGSARFSCSTINKSSLSRINQERDFSVFEMIYRTLLRQTRHRVGYSNIRIIDSTTELLNKTLFPLWSWDKDRSAVRACVVHDPYFELPDQIVIGNGKQGDTTLIKSIKLYKGITYLMDGGFRSYQWYKKIIDKQAYFISRQHKTVSYIVKENLPLTENDVISDQIVILGKDPRYRMEHQTRLIRFIDNKGKEMWLSTNRFDLTTHEIREMYRRRWEIEVFFKFLKQTLKLKKFFGTSKNAIKIQIYCALIAYLLAYLLKPNTTPMTEFMRMLRYALFLDPREVSFLTDA